MDRFKRHSEINFYKVNIMPDGLTAIFHFPHNLGKKPDFVMASPNNFAATGVNEIGDGLQDGPPIERAAAFYTTANATHISIYYNKQNPTEWDPSAYAVITPWSFLELTIMAGFNGTTINI